MFILDYAIYRIVGVILEMFWDKQILGSRLYNTRGYLNMIVCYTDDVYIWGLLWYHFISWFRYHHYFTVTFNKEVCFILFYSYANL